jgi:eukaryotic-like serine/threonine-protein kinase
MESDEVDAVANTLPGKYRVLTELGSGGMARVYLAVSRGLAGFNKLVVLKILKCDLARDAEFHDGFLREARVSARMNHPNVVAVNEVEERDGIPIMVMEYLAGQPLSAILRRMLTKAPLEVTLRILAESLNGLHYVHELADFDGTSLRLVHRDFTPQNIFVTYDGSVKVLDFGIAQVRRPDSRSCSTVVKGKLRYMSPEQSVGAVLDRRTDVFAAGIMLCEMLAGQRFWGTLSDTEVYDQLKSGDIPSPRQVAPSCPAELERICARALAFDRELRYAAVAEMQQDLDAFLSARAMYVTTQDIGRQIAQWFPSERRQEQRLIETNLSSDTYISWSSIAASSNTRTSKTPPATATQTIREFPQQTMVDVPDLLPQSSSTTAGHRPHLVERLGQIMGATLLLCAGGLLLRSPVHRAHAAPEVASASTMATRHALARITVHPDSATIALDGVPIGENPFAKEFVGDDRWHALRVQAPGYKAVEQRLQFNRDVDLIISLELETLSIPSAASPVPSATPSRPPPARVRQAVRPQTHTAARAASTSCSPPYTYDQRGLKQFKPECL